jgi:Concanavalin A-like lectin/glucanases superfamily
MRNYLSRRVYIAIISAHAINNGVFHHIALVRQNVTVSLYIDGVPEGAKSTPGVLSVGETLVAGVSACNGSNLNVPLTGQMDEIDLFNRALTASEIQAIFNAGTAGKCKGCQVNPNDVYPSAQGPYNKLDGKPQTMNAIFAPGSAVGNPMDLTTFAHACGFTEFDWVQVINQLPSPSPFFAKSNSAEVPDATQPIVIPPLSPIHDAPPGGYIYQFLDPAWSLYLPHFATASPFSYSPFDVTFGCADWDAAGCITHIMDTNYTLIFDDRPKDPCLPGGAYVNDPSICRGLQGTAHPFIGFTTQLVGVCDSTLSSGCTSPGAPSPPLYQWTWNSDFNGTKHGDLSNCA